jgi:hypothetical protein
MIKKSILFIFVIGMITVFTYGLMGSGAWFVDSASISGAISSGNFDLEVTGEPLQLVKIEPGADYQKVGEFCVQNKGDYDMKFRGYMKDVNDPNGLREYLLLKIESKAFNETDQNNYGPQDGAVLATDVPFTDLMVWNQIITTNPDGVDDPEPFAAGKKACYILSGKLTDAAGNDQLAKTLTANLFLNATQWINAGW